MKANVMCNKHMEIIEEISTITLIVISTLLFFLQYVTICFF